MAEPPPRERLETSVLASGLRHWCMGYLYSPASRWAKRGDGCSGPVPAATPPRPRDGAGTDESNLSIVVLECKAIRESAGRKLPPRRHTSGRAHARAETREARRSVGAALDHLDLVDNALGVAVRGLLVEVGEELGAPEPDALGEGGEGGQLGAVDRGEEALEAALGLGAVRGLVDLAGGLF
jgi:hypothetical protein